MHTFQLNSLLLFVTLVAVCLGVNYWLPGLGYGLLALALPAAVRTQLVLRKRLLTGEQASILDHFEVFAMSGLIVVGVGLAAIFAFLSAATIGWVFGVALFRDPAAGALFGVLGGILAVALLMRRVGRFMLREN